MKKNIIALLFLAVSAPAFAHPQGGHNQDDFAGVARALEIKIGNDDKCLFDRNELTEVFLASKYPHRIVEGATFPLPLKSDITPYWDCVFLRQHLNRDMSRKDKMPSGDDVFASHLNLQDQEFDVEGRIRYMGTIPKKYKYNVKIENGIATLTVKIHFDKNSSEKSHDIIKRRLQAAEGYWNTSLNRYSSNFKVKFLKVEDKKDSFFSVKLVDKFTRGPYDTAWSTDWDNETVTHEIGHMLGLDDEYNNVGYSIKMAPRELFSNVTGIITDRDQFKRNESLKCDITSLMCNPYAYRPTITKAHAYVVLSRVFERAKI